MGDEPGDVAGGVELVDERLRLAEVDLVVHQGLIDVVQAHAAALGVVEAAEGVERAGVAGGFGGGDVLEPGGREHRRGAVGLGHLVVCPVVGHGAGGGSVAGVVVADEAPAWLYAASRAAAAKTEPAGGVASSVLHRSPTA